MASADAGGEPPLVFIAVDVECTGQSLKKHAMVELGACYAVHGDLPPLQSPKSHPDAPFCLVAPPTPRFAVQIKVPDTRGWDQQCVKEFWMSTSELRAKHARLNSGDDSVSPKHAMALFAEWVRHVQASLAPGNPEWIFFVSDNPGFDVKWIDYYLDRFYEQHAPLQLFFGPFQPVIDSDSWLNGVANRHAGWGAFEAAAKKLGCTETPIARHTHDAADDADHIVQEFGIVRCKLDRLHVQSALFPHGKRARASPEI